MRRRHFITLLGGAAAAWPLSAGAQQLERMRRIGVLIPATRDDRIFQARLAAFLRELQELGWADGRNVGIEYRWAGGNTDDAHKFAAELIALSPDVIFALGTTPWRRSFKYPAPYPSCLLWFPIP